MKKISSSGLSLACLIVLNLLFFQNNLQAQCNNADFETGNFTGWTGTWSSGQCVGVVLFGACVGCLTPAPFQNAGFNLGPLNAAPLDTKDHHMMTAGFDANLPGNVLPTVWPGGGTYSACLGNIEPSTGSDPDAASLSYTFTVTPSNCNFTYHYAVCVADGNHTNGEQAYFRIQMVAGATDTISCAAYQVDATTAHTIGGFNTSTADPSVLYKPWSSVFVPLNNYIGQTVTITFITCSCSPTGCSGSHYCYAYLDCECNPLTLVSSSPTVCGGTNITLTAPAGAATYSWTGPGVVSGANSQIVTVNQAGHYVVTMTTFGTVPCTFTLDTIMPGSPSNPSAKFSASTVCVGTATHFTDMSTPPGQIVTWSWDFNNDGVADATTQNPNYTFPAAGTYPVKLTVGWPPCIADTTINVVVSPVPDANFTASSPVCEGTNSAIVYTGAAPASDTYTWNFDGGTVASGSGQGPYQVNWATGGNKNVTLVVSVGGCTSTLNTQVVVVNPFPGLIAPGDTSVCTGGSVTLVASGANTYSWTPATGLNSTNTATVIATPATTTTYTVTGTSASCTGIATVTVAVNPVPTSIFTTTSPVCVGQNSTITYTGNAGAGANYIWNFNGGTATPAGGQGPLQVNWGTAGVQQVSLTVSQSGCTSPQSTMPVTVNPIPTSTFTASTPLCIGANGTVTFTGSASGAATYTWGWAGGTVASGTGAGPYSVSWATAGTQNVTLSVSDNGCSSTTTTVPVVVDPIPTATFTGVSPVCALANSTLTYTGTATPAATYTWNFDGGIATPGGTTQGPQQVNWATAGVYNVALIVTENGCASPPVTVPITVNNTPTSLFTATGPVCTGESSTITYTGTGDNLAIYTWDFAGGTANPGTGQGPQTVTWNTAGTQNVTLVVSENGCTSPITTQPVIVNPVPTATFTVTSPLCVNGQGTITYTGTSSQAAVLTWGFSGGSAVPASGRGPIQISWATAGSQTVSLDVSDNGCNATPVSIPVTVNAIPVSDAGADVAYCSGNSATIGAANVAGNTYTWNPASGLSDPAASNPVVSLTNTANSVVTQTYTVTTSSNGCTSSDAAVVTVNPVPVVQFAQPAPQCLTGNSFNFIAGSTFLPSATFAWDFGSSAVPATSTSQNPTASYTAATTSTVTLTISQTNCTNTFTGSVTVYGQPIADFQPDTVYGCENFEVCFVNNSVGVSPVTYSWNFGDGEVSGQNAPCHLYVAPGVYSVFLKATSSQGCIDTLTKPDLIKVIANPVAAFTPDVIVVQQPVSEIDFTNQSLNSVSYLWTFSTLGVDNAVLGSATDFNPVYNFTQYGLYNVLLHAYNALGCVDSTQQRVTVLPPQNYFIPNAFTPNGDGTNDQFYVDLQEGAILREFRVFDRWGEKVHDGLYPWDGNYKGKPAPAGVYIYVAVIHLETDPGNLLRKGSVTLIR